MLKSRIKNVATVNYFLFVFIALNLTTIISKANNNPDGQYKRWRIFGSSVEHHHGHGHHDHHRKDQLGSPNQVKILAEVSVEETGNIEGLRNIAENPNRGPDEVQFSDDQRLGEVNQSVIDQLTDEIHELDHDHSSNGDPSHHGKIFPQAKRFTLKWLKSFNLKESIRNFRRWADLKIHQNPAYEVHAKNLAFLFAGSHLIEMSIGPVLATASYSLGLPDVVGITALLGGAVISVPGLDPFCILLLATYKGSERFRGSTTTFRLATVQVSRALFEYFGGPIALGYVAEWHDPAQVLKRNSNYSEATSSIDLPGGRIRFSSEGQKIWVKSLEVDSLSMFRFSWENLKGHLNSNVAQALSSVLELPKRPDLALPFYIQSVSGPLNKSPLTDSSEGPYRYRFVDGAIQVRGRWACRNFLSKV